MSVVLSLNTELLLPMVQQPWDPRLVHQKGPQLLQMDMNSCHSQTEVPFKDIDVGRYLLGFILLWKESPLSPSFLNQRALVVHSSWFPCNTFTHVHSTP